MDRSNEGIQEKESGGMDEYLSSFKVRTTDIILLSPIFYGMICNSVVFVFQVANYTVKDKDEPDVEVLKVIACFSNMWNFKTIMRCFTCFNLPCLSLVARC